MLIDPFDGLITPVDEVLVQNYTHLTTKDTNTSGNKKNYGRKTTNISKPNIPNFSNYNQLQIGKTYWKSVALISILFGTI